MCLCHQVSGKIGSKKCRIVSLFCLTAGVALTLIKWTVRCLNSDCLFLLPSDKHCHTIGITGISGSLMDPVSEALSNDPDSMASRNCKIDWCATILFLVLCYWQVHVICFKFTGEYCSLIADIDPVYKYFNFETNQLCLFFCYQMYPWRAVHEKTSFPSQSRTWTAWKDQSNVWQPYTSSMARCDQTPSFSYLQTT